MRVEFDRDTCIGMFQCVEQWERFERDADAGKARLVDGESDPDADRDVVVAEVPDGDEAAAKQAARVCPVDAIAVYDDDGTQVV